MNLADLTRALSDLKWKYPEPTLQQLIFEEVRSLPLQYEDIMRVGLKSRTAPNPGALIKHIKDLIIESKLSHSLYEVVRLDADEDYYQPAIEITMRHNFVMPTLFVCMDNIESYLRRLPLEVSKTVYEIAWVWLFKQDYKHSLETPECTLPKLWDMYNIEPF